VDVTPQEQHLHDLFNRFAAKVAKDYPHLTQGFFIYSPVTKTFYGYKPVEDEAMARMLQHFPSHVQRRLEMQPDLAGSMEEFEGMAMLLVAKTDHHAYTPLRGRVEDEVLRLFLHELGHHVAPGGNAQSAGGMGSKARRESIADTYSYLCDPSHETVQGMKDWRELVLWQRSGGFVFGNDGKYFTAPVLEAAMDLESRYDLSKLPAQDKANLAYRLALLAQPEQDTLDKLSAIFKPAQEAMENSWMEGFRTLAKIIFEDHGDLSDKVFHIGSAAIMPALKGKREVLETRLRENEVKELAFDGREWSLLRGKIAARDMTRRKPSQLSVEANDMFVLGHFDQPPGSTPVPAVYEGPESAARLAHCYDVYVQLRRLQLNGKTPSDSVAALLPPDVAALPQQETALLAGRIATKLATPKQATAPAIALTAST
jgi:hypothetical protein